MSDRVRYWLIVVSKEHLENGKISGVAQANHGKDAPLKRMRPGDYVVFYSPNISFGKREPYKKFTAIARVKEGEVYQVDMGGGFMPFRRDVEFLPFQEIDILPLLPELSFTQGRKNWGFMLRFGFFEITAEDFKLISGQQ